MYRKLFFERNLYIEPVLATIQVTSHGARQRLCKRSGYATGYILAVKYEQRKITLFRGEAKLIA